MSAIALKTTTSLVYHNITAVGPAQGFRDPDPKPKDSKVDYGIFLAPSTTASLKGVIDMYMRAQRRRPTGPQLDQLNALHQFESDRPMAVSIKIKRECGGDAHGPD